MQDLTSAAATTFHDVLNPLRNERVNLAGRADGMRYSESTTAHRDSD